MKKIFLVCMTAILAFSACKNQLLEKADDIAPQKATLAKPSDPVLEKLKGVFARALAISLHQSPQLREIIKTKALEMFNQDTEVLYFMIRDLSLGNGQTVESLILSRYEDGTQPQYEQLLAMMPTLTILVPKLPEDSFSAEKWNLQDTLAVAVDQENSYDVPLHFENGRMEILEGQYIPDFPVVVIKDTERVISDKDADFYKLDTRIFLSSHGVSFRFTFPEFDTNKGKRLIMLDANNAKWKEAYDIYNQYPQLNGWHRDYIYYNITPTSQNGAYGSNFKEHITSFSLAGVPADAFKIISQDNSSDPSLIGTVTNTKWSSNNKFTFHIRALVNGKNAHTEISNVLDVYPDQIFELRYSKGVHNGKKIKQLLDKLEFKTVILAKPLVAWDIHTYSTTWKISIEEVDTKFSATNLFPSTAKYAANVAPNTAGDLFKSGLKFGAQGSQFLPASGSSSTVGDNDPLGDVLVNFEDNVITGEKTFIFSPIKLYQTKEYNSGLFSISLEPVKVQ